MTIAEVSGQGMACGAGLPWLGVAATVAYFIVALLFPLIMRWLPGMPLPTEQAENSEHD
jgi:putative Mg2+ transporter-C (MgtC) family protein